ncbi:MAG: hypothetical protein C4527_29560 [Candidatus Omnitrophota bacterium]|nr:MAG: hypothetical protein C4527_29560 [Candidatus Omnitrophota bacterium]
MDLQPATTLENVYKTLSPEPLKTQGELDAYYRDQFNKLRGEDKVALIKLGLYRSFKANPFKALLTGHPGVGKSTELTRLILQTTDKFHAIRFSVTNDLDPNNFQPFDVLFFMMTEIAERTAKPIEQGGTGKPPSDTILKEIRDWFASEQSIRTETKCFELDIEAGAGLEGPSLWAKMLGLFATLKGQTKYAADRKKEIVEYRLQRISTLIELANNLIDECNQRLSEVAAKEFLFIGDNFEKPGIPLDQIESFFVTYANIHNELRAHMLFTIPINLVYSELKSRLSYSSDRIHCIPDTPVYKQDHTIHKEGRAALQAALEARVSPSLFSKGQMNRLIVASGGNLRDLFSLVSRASDYAILKKSNIIQSKDVTRVINELRTDYERSLGESPYDKEKVTYKEKADLMIQIYNGIPDKKIPDAVLHSLLRARVVQEFNGERWFGIHPLVVDILKEQKKITSDKKGKAPGGTY